MQRGGPREALLHGDLDSEVHRCFPKHLSDVWPTRHPCSVSFPAATLGNPQSWVSCKKAPKSGVGRSGFVGKKASHQLEIFNIFRLGCGMMLMETSVHWGETTTARIVPPPGQHRRFGSTSSQKSLSLTPVSPPLHPPFPQSGLRPKTQHPTGLGQRPPVIAASTEASSRGRVNAGKVQGCG